MRTADISGANDDVASPALPFSRRNVPPTRNNGQTIAANLKLPRRARRAFALIFGLCGVFLATDFALTENAANARAELRARLASTALAGVAADNATTEFARVAQALGSDGWARLLDVNGAEAATHGQPGATMFGILPDVSASRSIAGPLDTIEVGMSQTSVLSAFTLRSLMALALAGLAATFVLRRSRRADARLRAQALSTALGMSADGTLIWDAQHKLIDASEGMRGAELLASSFLKRGTSYETFLAGLRQAGDLNLISATPKERRLRLVLSVGETWDMRESLTEDGLLVTRFNNDSDRARLKTEVARLRHRVGEMADEVQTQRVRGDAASRSKTLFLGQLSHSLRTPLNHIIGFADLLRHQSYGPLGDQRYLGYAANIKQSGEALLDMLANMLELAEFDSGHRVLSTESIRVGEMFDWAEARYREQAARAGVRLVVERSEERMLTGDMLCLKRLMGNIIDNSLKFTPAGGSLTIASWPTDDGVVLEFTDTGIGISPDTLTVLNTSFALGSESNGNGIAIARAIAELSGGQLQINSSPGIGTTVAVVLPLKPARSQAKGKREVA